jgi:hypothetical protein
MLGEKVQSMQKKYVFIYVCFAITMGLIGMVILLGNLHFNMPVEYVKEFIYILPGPIYTDLLVLIGLPMLLMLGVYVACPTITRCLVGLHKFIKRGGSHAIAKLKGDITPGSIFKRFFLVTLLSFTIANAVVETAGWQLFRFVPYSFIDPMEAEKINYLHNAEGLFLATFLFIPVGFIMFLPLWCIEDSGIIMYKTFAGQRRTPDIEGVQGIYENILKGYASVSTAITLGKTIYEGFTLVSITDPAILTPIILILLPFLTAGLLSLPMLFYERKIDAIREKISAKLQRNKLETIQIPEASELTYVGVK